VDKIGGMEKIMDGTIKKYSLIFSKIHEIEKRMVWTELAYLAMNTFIFSFSVILLTVLQHNKYRGLTPMEMFFVLISLVIGMAICTYWVASIMRLQLKLKLHYFQARFLERQMNCAGECIFSDEALFFDPDIRRIESPDNKETLLYPNKGLLRMDGFLGAARPRQFSWMMPAIFFCTYMTCLVWVIVMSL
jgi:hypothetical protein